MANSPNHLYSKVKYPVAISNSLFRDSEAGKELPCQNCNLIGMGSMACYQEFCPDCGKIPPNREIKVQHPASTKPMQRQPSDINHLTDRLQAQSLDARSEIDATGCWGEIYFSPFR